ncbi:hypothetical protein H8K33_11500 [Undibacterium amnicola]|uniref:Transcriptional regulator n=1 Tax=Undibacterium amnicola TaxID=1834038 RepID=A0ABR6XRM4_9BURK|nr:PhaM family polyhydroxyalkanoate granule multifunctional regulatory protein [Undibacterium amnicola]MBC3832138.1 hypothetical protein [Undibacterium amnicola]
MQNPFQQTAGSNVNDPLAFVKKLWGDMQLPGMVTPTLSVDELDKQIKDLKTVESWLVVNMNMLKGTIQALEVQRATIAALKTMGESFSQAANASQSAAPNSAAQADTTHDWPMHTNKEAASSSAFNATTSSAAVREPTVEENEESDEDEEFDAPVEVTPKEEEKPVPEDAPIQASRSDSPAFHNPAAWWTVLQDQFKQALSHAMKDEEKPTDLQPEANGGSVPKRAAAKPRTKAGATKPSTSSAAAAKKVGVKSGAKKATAPKTVAKTAARPLAKTPSRSAAKVATKTGAKMTGKTTGKTSVRK